MLQKLKDFIKIISIVLIQVKKLIALVQFKKIIGSTEHWVEAVVLWCSIKKGVLKNFAEFTVNTCTRASFLVKLQACNFIKKDSGTSVFL